VDLSVVLIVCLESSPSLSVTELHTKIPYLSVSLSFVASGDDFQDWKEVEVMSAFRGTASFLQNKRYIMADPNSPLQSKEDTDHVRFNDIVSIPGYLKVNSRSG